MTRSILNTKFHRALVLFSRLNDNKDEFNILLLKFLFISLLKTGLDYR